MLPMRWRPNPASGELGLQPIRSESTDLALPARPLAEHFRRRVAGSPDIGAAFRQLAAEPLRRFKSGCALAQRPLASRHFAA